MSDWVSNIGSQVLDIDRWGAHKRRLAVGYALLQIGHWRFGNMWGSYCWFAIFWKVLWDCYFRKEFILAGMGLNSTAEQTQCSQKEWLQQKEWLHGRSIFFLKRYLLQQMIQTCWLIWESEWLSSWDVLILSLKSDEWIEILSLKLDACMCSLWDS